MKKLVPSDAVLVPETAKRVFSGEIFDVYQWPQELFDGSQYTFEMLKRPDTTSVICVVDDKVIVLDEEQPNSGKRRSFPGGRVDLEDEDILAAARREVLEETGYSFKQWRLVKVIQPFKKLEWFVHFLVAWDVAGQQDTAHEAGEKITVEYVSFEELKGLAALRVGFLHEGSEVFEHLDSTQELLGLPEFQGKEVDR